MTLTEQTKPSAAGASGVTTVASLARDWAVQAPDQVAMREKDFGIWREITWGDAWSTIEHVAHGLLALGVQPGDRVSIHAEDRPVATTRRRTRTPSPTGWPPRRTTTS